jgi:hypothetical protein
MRSAKAQQSCNGIRIFPDQVATSWPSERRLPLIETKPPTKALMEALEVIAARYGSRTTDFVATQLGVSRALASLAPA